MVTDLGKKNSRTQRAAYYLDWAAQHLKFQYQPFNVITQQINAYGRLQRMDNEEVLALRRTMASVRAIMQTKYKRNLHVAGNGVRASVDNDDAVVTGVTGQMKRLKSAKDSLLRATNVVDINGIKDPRIKAYMNRSVREVLKLVGSDDFEKKLLPPAEETKG